MYICIVLKQNIFKSITLLLLAFVVFISSTGFVSEQHFCKMTGTERQVDANCSCDDKCNDEGKDNCVRNSSCCSEKTNYLINAFASSPVKTVKVFLHLPVILNFSADVLSSLCSTAQINFSSPQQSPPLLTGRMVLLQKSLLLI